MSDEEMTVPEGYAMALTGLINAAYTVLVKGNFGGQFRIQLTDVAKPDPGAPPGHGSIVRELCTYKQATAVETTTAIAMSLDPEGYCEGLARPWNCEYEGGRIRLDNTLELQGFLEHEDERALILVDQHDRTKALSALNIYRAWRTVGIADRILESPIQRDGRVHTLLAVPDFAAYVGLSVHADKLRGVDRPHVEEWSKTYVYPNMTGYTAPQFSVERTVAVTNYLLNVSEPTADLSRVVAGVKAGFDSLKK